MSTLNRGDGKEFVVNSTPNGSARSDEVIEEIEVRQDGLEHKRVSECVDVVTYA